MQRSKRTLAIGSLIIILIGLLFLGTRLHPDHLSSNRPAKTPAVQTHGCQDWQPLQLVPVQKTDMTLHGISAITASNIWAIGAQQGPLIEHWDGQQWQIIQAPGGVKDGTLNAIATHSMQDIWAVGQTKNTPLALHWDGHTWRSVRLSTLSAQIGNLTGVAALAADNVWAVGSSQTGSASRAHILHWDGSQWNEVQGAPLGNSSYAQLSGITALSATNIWAVGSFEDATSGERELIEHWDGSSWQHVPPPGNTGIAYHIDSASLSSVTALSATNIWATGAWSLSGNGADGSAQGLIEHWDGTQWSRAQISGPESRLNSLNAIKAFSPENIWAVGTFKDPNTRLMRAYMQHWDGTQWSMSIWPSVYGQVSGNSSFTLNDVTGTPDGRILLAGSSTNFTQLPPIDDAAHNFAQPLVLSQCHT